MAREVRGEADFGDLGAGERVFSEVKTLVEADVDLAGGAERGEVADEARGELGRARVQRADLTDRQGGAGGGVAQLVQVAPFGGLDEVLGVAEEVGDRHDGDAVLAGCEDELFEVVPRVGVGPRDSWE